MTQLWPLTVDCRLREKICQNLGVRCYTVSVRPQLRTTKVRLGMKSKVRARAAELNAEPELFQFKANITYLIKSKAQKYHNLREEHKNFRKIMIYG